jgi:uncharacterized protein YecE (DUF72 family)
VRVLVGTSGFSYPQWKGNFYPSNISAGEMLSYYAKQLPTVEINNTFYRMPGKPVLAKWAEQVPAGFTFALKASQRITHQKQLDDVADSVGYFFDVASALGEKLGPTLFQLPPFMNKDLPKLKAFFSLVPAGRRVAVEFRNKSWFENDVFDALRSAGAALCVSESEELETPLVATADWSFLRLRRANYSDAEIQSWAERIRGQNWGDVFVFFKHEDEGKGPKFAAGLARHFAPQDGARA